MLYPIAALSWCLMVVYFYILLLKIGWLVRRWILCLQTCLFFSQFSWFFNKSIFYKFNINMLISWNFLFPVNLLFTQREYFKQGKIEQFRQILEEGSGPGQFFFNAFVLFIISPKNIWFCLASSFLDCCLEPPTFLSVSCWITIFLCRNWWVLCRCEVWTNSNP